MRQDVGSENLPALEKSGLNTPAGFQLADATVGTKRLLGLCCGACRLECSVKKAMRWIFQRNVVKMPKEKMQKEKGPKVNEWKNVGLRTEGGPKSPATRKRR